MTAMPEDLKAQTDADLAALETALVAEFDAAADSETPDVAVLSALADSVEKVRLERTARTEFAEAVAREVAALTEKVRQNAVLEEETPAEVDTPEAIVAEDTTPEDSNVEAEAETQSEEHDLVTASIEKNSKAPSASAVRAHSVSVEAPKPEAQVTLTAAADIPGYSGGQSMTKIDMAKAMHAKARTLSNGSGRVPVASINLPIENKLGADLAYNLDVLDRVTDPSALTAAGWCAPSNNLYEMFGVDAGDGLLDLPTVQITRGGLNVPSFMGIGEAADALWTWTEDSAGDEETKPCLYIPCPEFTDYRLKAEGLCLTHGNLTDRAFPELTARFIALTINAHLHRLSAAMIASISGGATGVTMSAVSSSLAGSILHAVDVQVADYRSQYRMSVNSVLEAVFPLWAKEAIRADLAMRTGVNLTNVSDAEIDAHFAVRKVRAQFLHDYQPMYGVTAATAFPTTMDFLLYPAGGYVRGDGGTIDLGVVRDSVLNATNDYTAAWTEQLYLVAKLGPTAREVTVTYAVDGVTGCCPTASAE